MAAADYDWIDQRNALITRALRKVGVVRAGGTPTTAQYNQGVESLEHIILDWQNKNWFPWTLRALTVAISAADDEYALSTDPPLYAIDSAWYRDSANNDTRLEVVSWRKFQEIPNKTQTGQPEIVAYDNGPSTPYLYVWPVPTASATILYVGVSRLKDFDTSSAYGDVPVHWQQALVYALTADLADEYGLPLNERTYYRGEAQRLFLAAKHSQVDGTERSFMVGAFE